MYKPKRPKFTVVKEKTGPMAAHMTFNDMLLIIHVLQFTQYKQFVISLSSASQMIFPM